MDKRTGRRGVSARRSAADNEVLQNEEVKESGRDTNEARQTAAALTTRPPNPRVLGQHCPRATAISPGVALTRLY
eukprot:4468651-Pyramimonas_sp.AAC.1